VADPAKTPSEAIVDSVGFDVAHDSDGIVVLTLRFPNGARSDLSVEGQAIGRLVDRLGLRSVDSLVGLPFSALAPILPANDPD